MTHPPYRPVVRAGDFLYVSGQLPMVDGVLVAGGIDVQTRQALANLDRQLTQHGANRARVVKTLVLLADIGDWAAMNVAYLEFFSDQPLPARSAFGVQLPVGALVEIEAVAFVGEGQR
jgi:2-iminobutanoate/2-iminopropanoate deaminase